ncbi:D-2-hydroxyacid dehydrogenase [Amycolatopsis marina]|uniref:D-2-hydroxyacid dehydrogenase n=1 Tax=Amycolatopsis marina TaxID=490629 RepID=UPI000B838CF9|nr:D-2-hydroxyacid dehydrogenase [Amycolatopsis marina]
MPAGAAHREVNLAVLVGEHRPQIPAIEGVSTRFAVGSGLREALDGANALLLWDFSATGLVDAWPAATTLEWVHLGSAGVDRVLTAAVAGSEVVMTNSRGVLDAAIAEYVLGLALAMVKDLPGTVLRQTRQRWEHRPTLRLAGTAALVVGPGSIGRAVGLLLAAVGVHVDAAGRSERAVADGEPFGCVHGSADLAAVVSRYDLVVLTAPLTRETRGLIDATVLAKMRPGARLINVGRGPLVDEQALVEALQGGNLAGAALDVVNHEPLPADHPLWNCPGTIISPHMAGDAVGWREVVLDLFLENLRRFQNGAPLLNVVDMSLGYVATQPGPVTPAFGTSRTQGVS